MLLATKNSKVHANKSFELRGGINGKGAEILVVQTIVNGNCTHSEHFANLAEGKNWFKKVCQ